MDSLINRQTVLDAVEKIEDEVIEGFGFQYEKWKQFFMNLPSAQPEIVRCNGCKHWINSHLCEALSRFGSFETKADFYCGYAKRKTDEEVN